jgi:uncharacterized protein
VFLIDSNIWIAHSFSSHPGHDAAANGLAQATSEQPAIFCRATQQSFLRLISTPALLQRYGVTGLTNEDAILLLDQYLSSSAVVYQEEPLGIARLWFRLARRKTASPKVWMDAYLAAFAIAGELTIITFDSDFKQFEPTGLNLQLLES